MGSPRNGGGGGGGGGDLPKSPFASAHLSCPQPLSPGTSRTNLPASFPLCFASQIDAATHEKPACIRSELRDRGAPSPSPSASPASPSLFTSLSPSPVVYPVDLLPTVLTHLNVFPSSMSSELAFSGAAIVRGEHLRRLDALEPAARPAWPYVSVDRADDISREPASAGASAGWANEYVARRSRLQWSSCLLKHGALSVTVRTDWDHERQWLDIAVCSARH